MKNHPTIAKGTTLILDALDFGSHVAVQFPTGLGVTAIAARVASILSHNPESLILIVVPSKELIEQYADALLKDAPIISRVFIRTSQELLHRASELATTYSHFITIDSTPIIDQKLVDRNVTPHKVVQIKASRGVDISLNITLG